MGELIFPFKTHQIVRSRNDIGVILGVLYGDDQLVIRVQWARNIGGRGVDTIHVDQSTAWRLDNWQPATKDELAAALAERRAAVENEIKLLLETATVESVRSVV